MLDVGRSNRTFPHHLRRSLALGADPAALNRGATHSVVPPRRTTVRTYTRYSMCMSGLERRVQLLVDPQQYSELEREAARTGRSVASLIRESIADHLAGLRSSRSAAADRLLASADSIDSAEDDWVVTKAALEQELIGKLP